MQTVSTTWTQLFSAAHKTEYLFDINGTTYYGGDYKGTPIFSKPLLDKPAIGRFCVGTLTLTVYPKEEIPKAASVNAYCRLVSSDGATVSEWLPAGKYFVYTRSKTNPLQLECRDGMIKSGTTYLDKTAFTTWPVSMASALAEICQIMGVSQDARNSINLGDDYVIDRPNEDTLISEVLSTIAAAHGGNFIMTESGKLRLVVLASPGTAAQVLGKAHSGFTPTGKTGTLSRIILTDNADNEFTAGDDTGFTISASCYSATQAIATALCGVDGDGTENSVLYGVTFEPYELKGAYLDPAIELGDTLSVTTRDNTTYTVVVYSITVNATAMYTCNLSVAIDGETDEEYPYTTQRELALSRTIRTDQTYFGNRINRAEGFVSELLVNGESKAKLQANASLLSMQAKEGDVWVDRIYFDAATGKYVITGDVTIQGLAEFISGLANGGTTVINGGNITTGQIKSDNGNGFVIDLNAGTITVGSKNEDVYSSIQINNAAISQEVTRAKEAEDAEADRAKTEEAKLSTKITQTESSIQAIVNSSFGGGINYIHNSSGLNGVSADWIATGTVTTAADNTKGYTVSNSCFQLSASATLSQSINTLVLKKDYTISCKVKKTDVLQSKVYVVYNGDTVGTLFDSAEATDDWLECEFTIKSVALNELTFVAETESNYLYVADIMVCEGETAKAWTPAPDEIYTSGVNIDKYGVTVFRSGTNEKTVISNKEFAGYDGDEEIFSLNGNETRIVNAVVKKQLLIGDSSTLERYCIFSPFNSNGEKGLNISLID